MCYVKIDSTASDQKLKKIRIYTKNGGIILMILSQLIL